MSSLLIIFLLVVLFTALSSTMAIYSPHHVTRAPGQFMQLQEKVKRDQRMALYHPHHNTRATGHFTKNHPWAKRATGRCPSECCTPCHEKMRNCKKRSRGVSGCVKGKFCDNGCSLFPIYSFSE